MIQKDFTKEPTTWSFVCFYSFRSHQSSSQANHVPVLQGCKVPVLRTYWQNRWILSLNFRNFNSGQKGQKVALGGTAPKQDASAAPSPTHTWCLQKLPGK